MIQKSKIDVATLSQGILFPLFCSLPSIQAEISCRVDLFTLSISFYIIDKNLDVLCKILRFTDHIDIRIVSGPTKDKSNNKEKDQPKEKDKDKDKDKDRRTTDHDNNNVPHQNHHHVSRLFSDNLIRIAGIQPIQPFSLIVDCYWILHLLLPVESSLIEDENASKQYKSSELTGKG